jgi:hypothetical protein
MPSHLSLVDSYRNLIYILAEGRTYIGELRNLLNEQHGHGDLPARGFSSTRLARLSRSARRTDCVEAQQMDGCCPLLK